MILIHSWTIRIAVTLARCAMADWLEPRCCCPPASVHADASTLCRKSRAISANFSIRDREQGQIALEQRSGQIQHRSTARPPAIRPAITLCSETALTAASVANRNRMLLPLPQHTRVVYTAKEDDQYSDHHHQHISSMGTRSMTMSTLCATSLLLRRGAGVRSCCSRPFSE